MSSNRRWLLQLIPLILMLASGCNLSDSAQPVGQATIIATPTGSHQVTAVIIATLQPIGSPPPVTPLGNGQYAIVAPTPAPPTPTPTPTPDRLALRNLLTSERIAFVSGRDGNREIYVMQADGSQPTRLTSHHADDIDPTWSPNGRKIAFATHRDGNYEIYLADAANGSLSRLTDDPAVERYPAWSPDGERLAFASNRDGNFEIYAMQINSVRLTRLTNTPGVERYPVWSPDGNYLAFESSRDGNPEIYVIPFACIGRPDGCAGPPIRLTHHPALDSKPAWSPDGKYLAFESERGGNPDIYLLNVDEILRDQASDSPPQRLTEHRAWDFQPTWSGVNRLLFSSNRNGNTDIHRLNLDSGQITQLTQNGSANDSPAWVAPANPGHSADK